MGNKKHAGKWTGTEIVLAQNLHLLAKELGEYSVGCLGWD